MARSCRIENYRNRPGEHCGSTAMRNLLFHYAGLDLTEGEVFGLGSGIDFMVLEAEACDPRVMIFGRGPSLETDVADALGVNYAEAPEPDDARAWEVVREEVLAGRPTMLSGDALYLDYRDFRVHFPSHRFVLLGFDDDAGVAWIADRIEAETQACSYAALAKSRNPPDFLSTVNLWGRFEGGAARRSLEDAMRVAIARAATRMLDVGETSGTSPGLQGDAVSQTRGLAALAAFAGRLEDLAAAEDFPRFARYASACIEAFGTGGGNFRNLYAAFLASAARRLPDVVDAASVDAMQRSAAAWTGLSRELAAAGLASGTDRRDLVAAAAQSLRTIAGLETSLFEKLAARVA